MFNPNGESREHTFEIDPRAKPKTMDLTPSEDPGKGKKMPYAIYRLDGDALTMCVDKSEDGAKRPTEFNTGKGDECILLTFKRAKSD